jgi:ABC-2 type transport system permease protein
VSLGVVAKVDLRETCRSWRLLGLSAAYAFFFAGASAIFVSVGQLPGVVAESPGFTGALVSPLALLVSLVGILLGYRTIVGERVSGTIRLLLSLPQARRELVVGKLLSRVVLVSVTATLGATVGYLSHVLFGGSVAELEYAMVIALALLLQAAFVGIGVGLSAGIESETVVVAAGLGSVLLFAGLWQGVVQTLAGVFSAVGASSVADPLTGVLDTINPVLAFSRLASVILETGGPLDAPWSEWSLSVFVLLSWVVVPVLLGTRRFERAELS